MTESAVRIEPIARNHVRDQFQCGNLFLNTYLHRYARQNSEKGLAKAYVMTLQDDRKVVGYYTLSASHILFENAPSDLVRSLPRYPLAVAWFEAAAKKGEADAMDLLSWYYINGSGVEKNIPTGVQWLAKAAELGLPTALIKLQALGFDVGPVSLKDGVAFSPTDVHLQKKH